MMLQPFQTIHLKIILLIFQDVLLVNIIEKGQVLNIIYNVVVNFN